MIQNIMGKTENAFHSHFLLVPQFLQDGLPCLYKAIIVQFMLNSNEKRKSLPHNPHF